MKQQKHKSKGPSVVIHKDINLKYRDETCSACKKKFRAGFAAEGYAEIELIGYHPAGINRTPLICNNCIWVLYHLMGHPSTMLRMIMPSGYHTYVDKEKGFSKKPTFMIIGKKTMKYNKVKLTKALKQFAKQMKKQEPWSNIDYFRGLKK